MSSNDYTSPSVPAFLGRAVKDMDERYALGEVLDGFFGKRVPADELRAFFREFRKMEEKAEVLLDLLPHCEDKNEGITVLARLSGTFLSRVIMLKEDFVTRTYIGRLEELGYSLHQAVEYFEARKDAAERDA